jgi:hypothetical protein
VTGVLAHCVVGSVTKIDAEHGFAGRAAALVPAALVSRGDPAGQASTLELAEHVGGDRAAAEDVEGKAFRSLSGAGIVRSASDGCSGFL